MEQDRSVKDSEELKKKAEDAQWDFMFERLVAFKKKYGHCNVPIDYVDDVLDCEEII